MLRPDDRLVLADLLRPPPGYEFDRAVATTFTLDLTAALVAPISLGAQRWTDHQDPITIMEAVRSVAERVDVFCQVGMIGVPRSATDLVAFLEPIVHEVRARRTGHLFHPKIWVLRFTSPDGGPARMRLLCGSRNLTHDRSWDLMVSLDGEVAERPTRTIATANRPIADLLRALPVLSVRPIADERRLELERLADDVLVTEWELPPDAKDVAFHTLGLGARMPDFAGSRHLVVSPFVTDDGLDRIVGTSNDVSLVAGADDLARLAPATLERVKAFTIDPLAGLETPDDDEARVSENNLTGLHAKAVFVDFDHSSYAFIGSMNATGAALGGNVEFLTELRGPRRLWNIDRLLDPEDGEALGALLLPFVAPDGPPPEPDDWSLENDLRTAAATDFTVIVTPDGERYRLTIECVGFPEVGDTLATIALHSKAAMHRPVGGEEPIVFESIVLADITPFLILQLARNGEERATVLRANLVGDPERRLDAVFARQIDTPEKLIRFILLVLQLAAGGQVSIDLDDDNGGEGEWWQSAGLGSGLLETITIALADNPDALDDIDRLITRLEATDEGRAIIPDGLAEFWAEVRTARTRLAVDR